METFNLLNPCGSQRFVQWFEKGKTKVGHQFEGTPRSEVPLEGRTPVRCDDSNAWSLQLLREIRHNRKVVANNCYERANMAPEPIRSRSVNVKERRISQRCHWKLIEEQTRRSLEQGQLPRRFDPSGN